MINDVAKSIIRDFESDIFVETGFFRGSTAVVIRSWFKDLEIVEVEINPIYCQYGREIFRNDPNTKIIQSDSKAFLKSNIDYFKKYNNSLEFTRNKNIALAIYKAAYTRNYATNSVQLTSKWKSRVTKEYGKNPFSVTWLGN